MSLCVTFYGMQIGRKGTILLGCLLICIGALLQAATYSVAQIIVGRIVTGAGIGNIAAAVPTYMVCHEYLPSGFEYLLISLKGRNVARGQRKRT